MELFLATAMAIHCQLHKLSSLCRETLHEMTTHSTQVGTVTCCHIVGDLHVTFQIKNQIYMLIPNSNVKNILTSATSFAENSQIQTLSLYLQLPASFPVIRATLERPKACAMRCRRSKTHPSSAAESTAASLKV